MKIVKLQIKPNFIFMDHFIRTQVYFLIFFIFYILLLNEIETFKKLPIMFIIYIIILIVVCLIKCFIDKRNYKKYYYNFYSDHLGYIDNHFLKKEIEIKYTNIKKISMYQNGYDKENDRGIIRIKLNNKKSILINKVDNITKNYEDIKKIIDELEEQ